MNLHGTEERDMQGLGGQVVAISIFFSKNVNYKGTNSTLAQNLFTCS